MRVIQHIVYIGPAVDEGGFLNCYPDLKHTKVSLLITTGPKVDL